MRFQLLFLMLFLTKILTAQTFIELRSTPPFEEISESSIAFSDINGDGTNDLLITGINNHSFTVTRLYTNDGMGNFTEVIGTPFERVAESSIAFSDINGDGHEDVLITGRSLSFQKISRLYTNDGLGNFTEINSPSLEGVSDGSIAFSDINGDGTNDLLITGEDNDNDRVSILYTNNGNGNFTEVINTPFDGLAASSVAFSDVNGDGDNDLFLTGRKSTGESVSKLYTNDGLGNFTEIIDTPFENVRFSSIAFSDVNGDNREDLLITGISGVNDPISKLYTNDGNGNFTEIMNTPFEGVKSSSVAFSDIDEDGDNDVLITGKNPFDQPTSKLYTNDGTGNFIEVIDTPFEGTTESSIAFSDVNGNGHDDLLITGLTATNKPISQLYINDGMGIFIEAMGIPFDRISASSIAFSDVNGNENNDVLITGLTAFDRPISKLYTNDGNSNFTEIIGTPFDEVWGSSIAFSDVNGDGSNDLLITGQNQSFQRISKLYTNDGNGNFTEMIGTPFEGVRSGSVSFSDVNGDETNDVLIIGGNSSSEGIAKLYTNDGNGNFTEVIGTPFDGVSIGSNAFSDVNGNGHNDVFITGQNNSGVRIAKLYTNDGNGNFTEMIDTPFEGVWVGSIAFSDVNGDETNDVLITGQNNSGARIAKLYTNDGNGNFTEMDETPFEGNYGGSIAFSDVNGNGHNDVLISGQNSLDEQISKLYINDGLGNFTEFMGTPFDGVWGGSIAFSDINNNGTQDILITGLNNNNKISKLYINDGIVSTDNLEIELSLDFNLSPNPTAPSIVNIHYIGTTTGLATLNLYSINGVLLKQQTEFAIEGQNIFPIDIITLNKGNYFMELKIGKKRGIAKFMVQ